MSAASHTLEYEETPSRILPSLPPRELDAEIEAAAKRAAGLFALGHELNFEVGPDGRLAIELRDLDGNVVKDVSPAAAVDALGGLGRL